MSEAVAPSPPAPCACARRPGLARHSAQAEIDTASDSGLAGPILNKVAALTSAVKVKTQLELSF